MAEDMWSVEIGEVDNPGNTGIPPVPHRVYNGAESGAREAFGEWSAKATEGDYRYVLLRRTGEVVEAWGTPPAVA